MFFLLSTNRVLAVSFFCDILSAMAFTKTVHGCSGSRGGNMLCPLPLSFLPTPCDFCPGLLFYLSLHLALGSGVSLGCRAPAEPLLASYPQSLVPKLSFGCGIIPSSSFMRSVHTYNLAFRTRTSVFILFLFHTPPPTDTLYPLLSLRILVVTWT